MSNESTDYAIEVLSSKKSKHYNKKAIEESAFSARLTRCLKDCDVNDLDWQWHEDLSMPINGSQSAEYRASCVSDENITLSTIGWYNVSDEERKPKELKHERWTRISDGKRRYDFIMFMSSYHARGTRLTTPIGKF